MLNKIKDIHEYEYNTPAISVASAPARFHLLGEHSWFFRDKTLSMAINFPVEVAISFRNDDSLYFFFSDLKDRRHSNLSSLKQRKEDRWANAIKSVLYGFEALGFKLRGMNFTVCSDILPSAGFGITTAIKVASIYAVRAALGVDCADDKILRILSIANTDYYETDNHVADNYAAMYSKSGCVLLTNHEKRTYENIPFDFSEKAILLVDAKVPRISLWDEETLRQPEYALLLGELRLLRAHTFGGWTYEVDRNEINEVLSIVDETTKRRLYSVIHEHHYLLEAREGIINNNFAQFARAVNSSHSKMRDLYEISCPEIDWILKRLVEINPTPDNEFNPVCCGRITGKGFGRCVYAILDRKNIPLFEAKLVEYDKIFGFKASYYMVEPSDGAKLLL
ncbi:galactokinase [Treponema zioleckii]|uniref:galactokinase n=1 Tax=Treponema zioleckii TaxID=331680 RepID=UPI001F5B34EB|nr:galactokinase family protein [Treponema zioleckii]